MATGTNDSLSMGLTDFRRSETTSGASGELVGGAPKRAPSQVAESAPGARLPRKIAGGFIGISNDLDARAREWRNMVRLLDQQRQHVEAAEAEYDASYDAFSRVVPEVQESGRALKAMLEATRAGDVSGDLAGQFAKNLKALDHLESVAQTLSSNQLSLRSTWEQYARSTIQAQKMREELVQNTGER